MIPLQLGLTTYAYHVAAGGGPRPLTANAPMTLEHFFRKTAELGLPALHISGESQLGSLEFADVVKVRDRAATFGLSLELGTGGTTPEHLQSMIHVASVLGSPVLRTVLGARRPGSASELAEGLRKVSERLAEVLPTCERYQVGLAIENHQDLTAAELHELIAPLDSPWLGICYDTGNQLAVLEDPVEALHLLGPYVLTVHLKDYQLVATPDGLTLLNCALGHGVVDMPRIFRLLAAAPRSPRLFLECALERIEIPYLTENFLSCCFDRSLFDLARTVRLVRDRGLPQGADPLAGSEEEVLARENDLVETSLSYALRLLGRPSAETDPSPEALAEGEPC